MVSSLTSDRPFAVFDIDGTVIRWQLYHAIGDALAKAGVIEANEFKTVREARMAWKKRSNEDSFRSYEQTMVNVFQKTLTGLRVADFERAADIVFEEYKDQVYTYTRDLMRSLKSRGYVLFAISGSPLYIINKLAHYYGFDDSAATTYASNQGIFTGQTTFVGTKATHLETLITKHGVSKQGSIAVGDSEGDIGLLKDVEQPIAFNPNRQLLDTATNMHWPIVLERKNAIYRLEYIEGEYRLQL